MFGKVKSEIRILGWDDAPFTFKDRETMLIGVVCRGGTQIDGVITAKIKVDGSDVTKKLAKATNESRHREQLRLIMLDGITFGGFNIVDIGKLHEKTGLPVIVIIRQRPDMKSIEKSLSKFRDFGSRWELIKRAGEVKSFEVRNRVLKGRKAIYYQNRGLDDHTCEKIINLTAIHSVTPEPVRIAHLIASGFR
jgi:endonuclease V-like protein UPF0215 family